LCHPRLAFVDSTGLRGLAWSVDDDIIDLTPYLARQPGTAPEADSRGFFSVWGGEGDRSRFALPLWRSVYLVSGKRAGIVWTEQDGQPSGRSFFVLDLGAEPARTDFGDFRLPTRSELAEPPVVFEAPDRVTIFLGAHEGRSWFILLDERERDTEALEGKTREDLLFLAGECAGLLFYRELADELD